jgi:hypothetical protein
MKKMKIFGILFGGLLLVALGASVVVAQGSHFEDRDSCVANCRAMAARGPTYVGDRKVDPRVAYARCERQCDKRFWKDVEGKDGGDADE